MIKWIKKNWIRIIFWVAIICLTLGVTLLLNYGCSQGWYDCSVTNTTTMVEENDSIAGLNLMQRLRLYGWLGYRGEELFWKVVI